MRKAKGWFTGYNSNVDGHEHGKTRYFVYNGGTPKYVATISEVAETGYAGLHLTRGNAPEGGEVLPSETGPGQRMHVVK